MAPVTTRQTGPEGTRERLSCWHVLLEWALLGIRRILSRRRRSRGSLRSHRTYNVHVRKPHGTPASRSLHQRGPGAAGPILAMAPASWVCDGPDSTFSAARAGFSCWHAPLGSTVSDPGWGWERNSASSVWSGHEGQLIKACMMASLSPQGARNDWCLDSLWCERGRLLSWRCIHPCLFCWRCGGGCERERERESDPFK